MKERIETYILSQLNEYKEEGIVNRDAELNTQSTLHGKNGILSSLHLVTLIVDIEDFVASEFDKFVTIADDRAFSENNSPFATVDSLAGYTEKLIKIA